MINAVIGSVVSVEGQELVIRAGSIEFSLIVSGQCAAKYASLRGEEKDDVRVLTVLSHHEDSMLLYGFIDAYERDAFLQLQSVSGIGPKQALKILSGITVENLAKALDEGNVKMLSSVPGVGAKTGQKMILQLRGQLVMEEQKEKLAQETLNVHFKEVISGLTDMGYDRRQCEDVVRKIEEEKKDELAKLSLHDQEELIFKNALRYLG